VHCSIYWSTLYESFGPAFDLSILTRSFGLFCAPFVVVVDQFLEMDVDEICARLQPSALASLPEPQLRHELDLVRDYLALALPHKVMLGTLFVDACTVTFDKRGSIFVTNYKKYSFFHPFPSTRARSTR